MASLWLGRLGCLSLGPGRCTSCSGAGILLGRSCHVSAGVPMGPGDTITSRAGSGSCRSWKGSSSFLLGLCEDTARQDTRAHPGPGCLSSLAGPPWALGQVRVLSGCGCCWSLFCSGSAAGGWEGAEGASSSKAAPWRAGRSVHEEAAPYAAGEGMGSLLCDCLLPTPSSAWP